MWSNIITTHSYHLKNHSLLSLKVDGIKYICDETNNPPDILDKNEIVSKIYIKDLYALDTYHTIDMSNYLTWFLQNTSLTREQIYKYGIICFNKIFNIIKKNSTMFYLEWDLFLTRICIELINNPVVVKKFLESLSQNSSLIKSEDIDESNEVVIIQTEQQFLKNTKIKI